MSAIKYFNLCKNFQSFPFFQFNRRLISSASNPSIKFKFEVSKFNDIHIKSDNVTKFVQETKSDLDTFDSCLKRI